MVDEVRNLIYLPGLRGNPERHYVISAGVHNTQVASTTMLPASFTSGERRRIARLKRLEDDLKQLGLTSRVTTRAVDDTRVEVRVRRLPAAARGGARDTVNIADVGFGVSQSLPVLVALLAAARNQIVLSSSPNCTFIPAHKWRWQTSLSELRFKA